MYILHNPVQSRFLPLHSFAIFLHVVWSILLLIWLISKKDRTLLQISRASTKPKILQQAPSQILCWKVSRLVDCLMCWSTWTNHFNLRCLSLWRSNSSAGFSHLLMFSIFRVAISIDKDHVLQDRYSTLILLFSVSASWFNHWNLLNRSLTVGFWATFSDNQPWNR